MIRHHGNTHTWLNWENFSWPKELRWFFDFPLETWVRGNADSTRPNDPGRGSMNDHERPRSYDEFSLKYGEKPNTYDSHHNAIWFFVFLTWIREKRECWTPNQITDRDMTMLTNTNQLDRGYEPPSSYTDFRPNDGLVWRFRRTAGHPWICFRPEPCPFLLLSHRWWRVNLPTRPTSHKKTGLIDCLQLEP